MERKAELFNGCLVWVAFHFYKRCFSIRDARLRKVIGYADRIRLTDVRFIVLSSGRERVLRDRMKNVHAFVQGLVSPWESERLACDMAGEATYNPYKAPFFMLRESGKPLLRADEALCVNGKCFLYGETE